MSRHGLARPAQLAVEFDAPRLYARELLGVLNGHGVQYVVIGMFAALLQGSPLATRDIDICPSREPENLDRLATALHELDARIRTPDDPRGIPFPHEGEFLGRVQVWNLRTRVGDLDVSFEPSGTRGYDDLRQRAKTIHVGDLTVPVASLLDVVRSKEAAGRQRDRQALPTLRMLLERSERGRNDPSA
jgi:hypothetical protein